MTGEKPERETIALPPEPVMHPNAEWCDIYARWHSRFGPANIARMQAAEDRRADALQPPAVSVDGERDMANDAIMLARAVLVEAGCEKPFLDDGVRELMAQREWWKNCAAAWHEAVEAVLTIAGLSPALSAKEAVEALRNALASSTQPESAGQAERVALAKKIDDALHACAWTDGAFLADDEWSLIIKVLRALPAVDASADVDVALKEMQSAIADMMVADWDRQRLTRALDALVSAFVGSRALANPSATRRQDDVVGTPTDEVSTHPPADTADLPKHVRDIIAVAEKHAARLGQEFVVDPEKLDAYLATQGQPTDKTGAAVGGRDGWQPIETAPRGMPVEAELVDGRIIRGVVSHPAKSLYVAGEDGGKHNALRWRPRQSDATVKSRDGGERG